MFSYYDIIKFKINSKDRFLSLVNPKSKYHTTEQSLYLRKIILKIMKYFELNRNKTSKIWYATKAILKRKLIGF